MNPYEAIRTYLTYKPKAVVTVVGADLVHRKGKIFYNPLLYMDIPDVGCNRENCTLYGGSSYILKLCLI